MSGADLAKTTLGRGLLYFNSVVKIIELEFDLFLCDTEMGAGGGEGGLLKSYLLFYEHLRTTGMLTVC
jgi:hypothetical protein